MDDPPDRVNPDAVRAVAEVLDQIEDLGHVPQQIFIEPYERDHYTVNIDTTCIRHGSTDSEQKRLKQISEETTEAADEVAVVIMDGQWGEEHVFWELEAMIRITEQGG